MTKRTRPTREALFVLTPSPDGAAVFQNMTARLGRPFPLSQPKAIVGLEVHTDVVAFTFTQLTKKAAQVVKTKNLELPRPALTKALRRGAANAAVEAGHCIVEVDGQSFTYTLERDTAGTVSLDGEDYGVTVDVAGLKLTLVLPSARAGRVVSVAFNGYANAKPGDTVGLIRAASMALFSLTQLAEFRVITGIDAVHVPAARGNVARKAADRVNHEVVLRLFTDTTPTAFVGEGTVVVEIDTQDANPATGKLQFHVTTDDAFAALLAPYTTLLGDALASEMAARLGHDDVAQIALDIVLGDLASGTVERLRETLREIPGMDITPTRYAPRA
jgi:hypothetical protein